MATTTAPPEADGKKQQVVMRPFRIGAQPIDDRMYEQTVTLTAAQQSLTPIYDLPSTAYLNDVYILVQATVTGNTADVAFSEDGPFSVFQEISLWDTGSTPIIGPLDGWELYVINKYGGYRFQDDPKNSPTYHAQTGTGDSGGSFTFVLRLPVELVPRDALGSLTNKSSSTPYKVKATIAPLNKVYSTEPTAAPSVRIRMTPVSYWEPTAHDGSGNPVAPRPPGSGTTQYWSRSPYTLPSVGTTGATLNNSTGLPIRNLIFVLRDANGSRAQGEQDWPDPFQLQLQSNMIVDRCPELWAHRIGEDYDYREVGDGPGEKDNGVYVLPFNRDFGHKPGWETRRGYLRVGDGMRLEFIGNLKGSGAHTLTVLTNHVGVASGVTLAQLTT